ncbi:MAG: hypothetical protein AB7L09_01990 [Nitrospira sp.]
MQYQETDWARVIRALREAGIHYTLNHAPCNHAPGKDDEIQKMMIEHGHNITTLATIGIDMGDETLVFFTGASDVPSELAGSFMFRINRRTKEVHHHTRGVKIIARAPV